MQSKATTGTDYLKEVPPERLEAVTRIRNLCKEELTGYKEAMRYGMPIYEKNNVVEVAFNSQKNYIALYILKVDVMKKHLEELRGINVEKVCIRYTKPDKIDFTVIRKMLSDTYATDESICG